MGTLLLWIGRAVGFLLTSAGGWAASDIYNEQQTSKQAGADISVVEAAKKAYGRNRGKWLFLSIAAVVVFTLVMFVIKPLIKGSSKSDISIL